LVVAVVVVVAGMKLPALCNYQPDSTQRPHPTMCRSQRFASNASASVPCPGIMWMHWMPPNWDSMQRCLPHPTTTNRSKLMRGCCLCVYVYCSPVAVAVVAVGLRLRLQLRFVSGFGATAAAPRSRIAAAVWVMVAVAGAALLPDRTQALALALALARTNVLIHERVLMGRRASRT